MQRDQNYEDITIYDAESGLAFLNDLKRLRPQRIYQIYVPEGVEVSDDLKKELNVVFVSPY